MYNRLRLMWYALVFPADLVGELLDVVREYNDFMHLVHSVDYDSNMERLKANNERWGKSTRVRPSDIDEAGQGDV